MEVSVHRRCGWWRLSSRYKAAGGYAGPGRSVNGGAPLNTLKLLLEIRPRELFVPRDVRRLSANQGEMQLHLPARCICICPA